MEISNYPKSYKLLTEFMKKMLEGLQAEMFKNQGVIPPDIDPELVKAYVDAALKANIRLFYDFFDSNNIYVNISGVEDSWYYTIGLTKDAYQFDFDKRIDAEVAGFEQAFKKLEDDSKKKDLMYLTHNMNKMDN